ncbi:MAG: tetratricopeptide repeat protein, partial [Nitrolancea sp.]
RPALAMRQYQLVQAALRTHLDAEPTLSTRQLHADIATGQVIDDNAPKLSPLHSSLPKPMTSFIGRNADVTEVSEHVRTERLVMLIGAGGCGKSRLALEVATKLRSEFQDGVGFVELASVSDPELVPQTIAVALGLDSGTRRSSATTVAESLRTHRALIVLDNCEHLIDACAKFAARLLSVCSSLHILATSQERLRIEGEFTWRVPSLSTPEESSELRVDQALQSEAIQLFVDRATRLRPDFDLNDRNVNAIVEISRRLDGIPLAIELAAARVNVLAPEEIAMRLDQALHLLVTSDRERSERHQTLRAALGWSYGLLSEPEQKTLRRLAVFAGGWSLEAAEAVLPDGNVARADVVNLLSNLTDRSLVQTERVDGGTRYDLLDTVRQYALERLQLSGERETMRQRHAEHLAMLADAAEPELHGPDQADWLKRFDREIDNLRAALAWARDGEHASIGFRLCWGMWRFWNARGYLDEGRRWMNSFLILPHKNSEVSDRVRVLFAAARFAMLQSDDDQAIRHAVECRDTASQIQDRDNLSGSLTVLGHVHLRHGETELARIAYEGALSVREEQGDQWGVAISIMSLARVAHATGDYARAIELYESSRAMFLTTGDSENAALSLCRRADISLELGEFEVAERLLQDGLNEFRAVGNRVYLNECLINLGRVEIERGNLAVARELLAQALTSAQQLHALREVTSALEGFALLAAIHGQAKRALLLAAATDRLRAQTGDSPIGQGRSRLDTALAAFNRTLNPVERAAAVARGRLIGIDRAVVLAMSDDDE